MTDADEQLLRERAVSLRLFAFALLVGTVTIVAVFVGMVYLAFGGRPIVGAVPAGIPIITLVGLVVALSSLMLGLVLPDRLRQTLTQRPTARGAVAPRLIAGYANSFILGAALAEAAAIMGAVFFLVEGHWLSLVPVGLGILLMIWRFPTEAGMRDWVERQLAEQPDRPADAGV